MTGAPPAGTGRVLQGLGAIAIASFLFAVVGSILAPEPEADSVLADSFSRSAIGHRAFVEFLRELGVPVIVSRWNSGERAGAHAVLLLAEPVLDAERLPWLKQMLGDAERVLLVLPKWTGDEDPDRPGWIVDAKPVPGPARAELLKEAGLAAHVVRGPEALECPGSPTPTLRRPQLLVLGEGLEPVVSCTGGVLVARAVTGKQTMVVLSDPDVVSNHGLGRGDNALVASTALGAVRRDGEPVVVDEVMHGFRRAPSVFRELFRWPAVAALVQAALAVLAMVAAALPRFGRALPTAPVIAPGKEVLVRNTSDLLVQGRHAAWLLGRYLAAVRRDAAEAYRGPAGQALNERTALAEAERRRRVPSLATVEAEAARLGHAAPPAAVLSLAVRAHRWKQEMTRGPR